MSTDRPPALTRRAFAAGMTGSLTMLGATDAAAVVSGRSPAGDADAVNAADLRDAALRGLARAGGRGDPVLAGKADKVLAQLDRSDPEGAMLVRIYRLYDAESAAYAYWGARGSQAATSDLALLHAAVRDCRAVAFHYTDLDGDVTVRTVLPLALVHPPQGIKLLAWCEKRQDYRQFFVRALRDLTLRATTFRDRRLGLLRQLADSASRT